MERLADELKLVSLGYVDSGFWYQIVCSVLSGFLCTVVSRKLMVLLGDSISTVNCISSSNLFTYSTSWVTESWWTITKRSSTYRKMRKGLCSDVEIEDINVSITMSDKTLDNGEPIASPDFCR